MKFDTIVVGAGIAGLTAAAYMAKAGKKVILFERQHKVGGLIQTFQRDGVYFDGGLRSIENSGIVFPMLKQLGIEIEFHKSITTIGVEDKVINISEKESLIDYEKFLQSLYPENADDIKAIVAEIRKIMGYMDILYGIDNPAFLDLKNDKDYLLKTILPWMFKFIFTVRKIAKLNEPVEEYLKRFTSNQSLIDIIAQHFFQKTPASFALSYFSLYLDYHYPKGGTATLVESLEKYIVNNGGTIKTDVKIEVLNPEKKYIIDNNGNQIAYDTLIWAGDQKHLYNSIPINEISNNKLATKIQEKRDQLSPLKGGDSVYTIYLTVDKDVDYFRKICSGHFFYTPLKDGLSKVSKKEIETFLNNEQMDADDTKAKEMVFDYLEKYFKLNTFEIAIPAIRDAALAPTGKTGLIVSLLFDYSLAKKINDLGWTKEVKKFLEKLTIKILNDTIFPDLEGSVIGCFSSSPLTIENLTGNTQGGITGWAFTNKNMPAVNKMLQVAKSVETILPSVYQAGQWVYSPSGMPISILTGKLAADKAMR